MSDYERCACGEELVGKYGTSGTWMHYAATHTRERCVIEDWRTLRWRFFVWLSGLIDSLSGSGREEPRTTVTLRQEPCLTCGGVGWFEGVFGRFDCGTCEGSGRARSSVPGAGGRGE
jgi:hypothetical protein